MRWLGFLAGVLLAYGSACSTEEPSGGRIAVAESAGPSGGAGQQATASCAPGASQACYCPDGSMSGRQSCLSDGTQFTQCAGCRTGGGGPGSGVMQDVIEDGALCRQLYGFEGCQNQSFRSEELPASILFLVDRSGSMSCNPPEYGQPVEACEAQAQTQFPDKPTKWDITSSALVQVFNALVDSGASAGLAFLSNNDECGVHSRPAVPVAPLTPTQADALNSALSSTVPGGGTPLVGGVVLSYAHLYEEAGLNASGGCAQPPCGAAGNRYVVLISDGADSCPTEPISGACGGKPCTDFLLDQSVHDAAGVNIRTFVIGAPGSEPARGFLSELALSGGTAKQGGTCDGVRGSASGDCHFDMTTTTDFAADLSAALAAISGSAVGCEFPVPQQSTPTENVNVQIRPGGGDPQCLAFDESPCDGGANGFQFGKRPDGSKDLSRVVLCGQACEQVRNDPAVQVDVVLGCEPIILL